MAEGQRDEFKPSPSPARALGARAPGTEEQFCLSKSFFPSIKFMDALGPCWWARRPEQLQMLSRRGKDNHSHQNTHHGPGSSLLLLLQSPQKGFSPLLPPDSLGASLVYKLRGSGQRLINVFLHLSGCQKTPHGNQAKLLMRAFEDKLVFVRHLQITARL